MLKRSIISTIEQAGKIGHFADPYRAIGYMGLSRIYEKEGLTERGQEIRQERQRTIQHYSFILGE